MITYGSSRTANFPPDFASAGDTDICSYDMPSALHFAKSGHLTDVVVSPGSAYTLNSKISSLLQAQQEGGFAVVVIGGIGSNYKDEVLNIVSSDNESQRNGMLAL